MTKCDECKQKYPDEMVQTMFTSEGHTFCCPICALSYRNVMHGLPEGMPFSGEIAQELHKKAVEFNANR